MSHSQCEHTTTDASRPRTTLADHFVQVNIDASRQRLTFANCYVQAKRDVGSPCTTMNKQYAQAVVDAVVHGQHRLSDAPHDTI